MPVFIEVGRHLGPVLERVAAVDEDGGAVGGAQPPCADAGGRRQALQRLAGNPQSRADGGIVLGRFIGNRLMRAK